MHDSKDKSPILVKQRVISEAESPGVVNEARAISGRDKRRGALEKRQLDREASLKTPLNCFLSLLFFLSLLWLTFSSSERTYAEPSHEQI